MCCIVACVRCDDSVMLSDGVWSDQSDSDDETMSESSEDRSLLLSHMIPHKRADRRRIAYAVALVITVIIISGTIIILARHSGNETAVITPYTRTHALCPFPFDDEQFLSAYDEESQSIVLPYGRGWPYVNATVSLILPNSTAIFYDANATAYNASHSIARNDISLFVMAARFSAESGRFSLFVIVDHVAKYASPSLQYTLAAHHRRQLLRAVMPMMTCRDNVTNIRTRAHSLSMRHSYATVDCFYPQHPAQPPNALTLTVATKTGTVDLHICSAHTRHVTLAYCSTPAASAHYVGRYVHDFINYHAWLGYERFHIYDRYGQYRQTLQHFIDNGLVVYHRFPSFRPLNVMTEWAFDQLIAGELCRWTESVSARWLVNHDLDEYLTFPSTAAVPVTRSDCFDTVTRDNRVLAVVKLKDDVDTQSLSVCGCNSTVVRWLNTMSDDDVIRVWTVRYTGVSKEYEQLSRRYTDALNKHQSRPIQAPTFNASVMVPDRPPPALTATIQTPYYPLPLRYSRSSSYHPDDTNRTNRTKIFWRPRLRGHADNDDSPVSSIYFNVHWMSADSDEQDNKETFNESWPSVYYSPPQAPHSLATAMQSLRSIDEVHFAHYLNVISVRAQETSADDATGIENRVNAMIIKDINQHYIDSFTS